MEGVGNRANFCNLCRNGENYRENHVKNARLLSHRGQQIFFKEYCHKMPKIFGRFSTVILNICHGCWKQYI